jgi:hypothetical protein
MKLFDFTKAASVFALATHVGMAQAEEAPTVVEGVEKHGITYYNLPTLRVKKSDGVEFLTTGGTTKIAVQDGVVEASPKIIFKNEVLCLAPGAVVPVACPPVPCSGSIGMKPSKAGPSCVR